MPGASLLDYLKELDLWHPYIWQHWAVFAQNVNNEFARDPDGVEGD